MKFDHLKFSAEFRHQKHLSGLNVNEFSKKLKITSNTYRSILTYGTRDINLVLRFCAMFNYDIYSFIKKEK